MTDQPAASATDQPDSIGIAIPPQWTELPIERARFDRFCRDLRQRWTDDGQWDRALQRRAELLLARVRRDIVRAGIQFSAMFVGEPTTEDLAASEPVPPPPGNGSGEGAPTPTGTAAHPDGSGGRPLAADAADESSAGDDEADALMATVTVGVYDKASLGTSADLTLGNLVMAFGSKPKLDDESRSGLQYKSIVNLDPPVLVDLPIGQTVRLRRLYELLEPGALPQRFYGESYLTPFGDDGQQCTIAHFTTINLGLARVFAELFATIAGTLQYFTPDQETSFESEWVDTFDD